VANQKSFLLARRQHQRIDRVTTQTLQRTQALVAVQHPEPLRIPSHRRHHDRHLLAVLLQRHQQTPLLPRVAYPKLLVVQVQLVELQIHGR
jgi:hypothetical protein